MEKPHGKATWKRCGANFNQMSFKGDFDEGNSCIKR